MRMTLHPVTLPLRHPFRVAHGERTVQHNLVVELAEGEHRGFGEGAGIPYYGVTPESMSEALESARDAIESAEWEEPGQLWSAVEPLLHDQPFALCALDGAAHDLWGKRLGKRVHELWGLSLDRVPQSNYTIGIDTIERMVAKLKECAGFPAYKVKLGTDHDLEIVAELRKHTDAVFRVDANTAWTAEQTIEYSFELKEMGVEFIEQPLHVSDHEQMIMVRDGSALPVIADESCVREPDVEKCAGHFHGVNVKLNKCGGLTPARRMLRRAEELGLKKMVGCMTETTVGISAIGQLLPMLDYVDMDGALLLNGDVAEGVRVDLGTAVFPETPGNGITWRGVPETS